MQKSTELHAFAARLAQGPAFLVAGLGMLPSPAGTTAGYSWSGVYTSRHDLADAEQYRADWRTVTSLGPMVTPPSRSQTDLQVRFLFGAHHLPDADKPPQNMMQEADARMRSSRELTRLVTETVTPRGVIAIEGWLPDDRLDVRDVAPMFRELGAGQVHLFSAGDWASDPYIDSLRKTGQVVLHQVSLDEALEQLIGTGALVNDRSPQAGQGIQHVIAIGDTFVDIDIHTWNQIRRSARPIDLDLLAPPVFSSDAARYQEFRNFTGAPEGAPRWRGLAAGLNIRRDFERTLAESVSKALKSKDLPAPIIVCGQTATGKSIALAALALDLARTGDVAVLHQSRRGTRPSSDDLDVYAAWAEEKGAAATVLIWDGMVHPSEYESLSRQLRSRGRKVLVVGSAYTSEINNSEVVNASAELSEKETTRLIDHLASFGVQIHTPKGVVDSSFLAFLYHTLPETEFGLRRGLAHEMRAAEKGMEKLVRERGSRATDGQRATALSAALQAAGFSTDDLLPMTKADGTPLIDQTFYERSSIQKITTLVLIAGRDGVSVPIDLALRILGREGSESIRDALNSFDIIRELDDDAGEYFLTVRSRLEAELLAQHEISLEVEIEVIKEVIRNARLHEGYASGPDEVQFVVSLLERFTPNSRLASRYKRYYADVSETFAVRRASERGLHPRFALQESIFARGSVHWRQDANVDSARERISALEHNRDLLEDVLADSGLSSMLRLSLTVELASTLGAVMHEIASESSVETSELIVRQLDDILDAVLVARAIDPGNLHPIDVLAWSTRDAIKTQALSAPERLNRLANAVATLETVDRGPLSETQIAQLDKRTAQLNQLLGDDDAFWENVRSLEANADPAATFFLAKFEAEGGPSGESAALSRLRSVPLSTRRDWRCAQLLLELEWKTMTGHRLLQGERVPVFLSASHADRLLQLSLELDDAELPDRYKLLFVRAVSQFTRGDYLDAKQAFRDVENLTRQLARRIYTVILLVNEDQTPRVYTGIVQRVDSRQGEIWVNEIGVPVRFDPQLFSGSKQILRNQQMPGFVIGFKLSRGPVAEPRSAYRGHGQS